MSLRKIESSFEKKKKNFTKGFFSKGVKIQSYQRLPWISFKVTKKYRNANPGDSYSLANKSNLIVALYKTYGIFLG